MMCIIFANLLILKMQNFYTGWNELLMFGHITFFFVSVYFWQDNMQDSVIYKFWDEYTGSPTAWLGCILCTMTLWTLDDILISVKTAIRNMFEYCFLSEPGYKRFG